MFNVEASSKPINKNNGKLSTLEDFGKNKKEGFTNSAWLEFGYNQPQINIAANKGNNINRIVKSQIVPLEKQQVQWNLDADKIQSNYSSIVSDYDKMVILRDQLNENPPYETRTMTIGPSMNRQNVKIVDVTEVDMSYQRVIVESPVNSQNEATGGAVDSITGIAYSAEDTFDVTINSKTITVTKTGPVDSNDALKSDGWDHNLKINIKVETIPEKKYFHHKDDWEFGDKRRTQREQHMDDTKELLLYTNQFYIIGSITTALTLIFAYKHYG